MPNYKVTEGYRTVVDDKIVEGGDTVSLPKEQGDALMEVGVLESPRRAGSRRAGWTGDDDADDSDAKPAKADVSKDSGGGEG